MSFRWLDSHLFEIAATVTLLMMALVVGWGMYEDSQRDIGATSVIIDSRIRIVTRPECVRWPDK